MTERLYCGVCVRGGCVTERLYCEVCVRGGCVTEAVWVSECVMLSAPPSTTVCVCIASFHMGVASHLKGKCQMARCSKCREVLRTVHQVLTISVEKLLLSKVYCTTAS